MPLLSSSKSMGYSATPSVQCHAQNVMKQHDTSLLVPTKHISSIRNPSFSSSSSSSFCSFAELCNDSPLSLASPPRFTGVPFSWEHFPGIPKKPSHKKKDSPLLKVLPLPPPTSKRFNSEEVARRKKNANECFKDPFITALVECSKGDEKQESCSNFWSVSKVSRNTSGRFGFINLKTSCTRTCAVSESLVYLPRSRRTYDHLIA